MKGFSQRVFESAVAWSFLSTALRIGANFLVLPILLRKLPPEHLGLWYIFGALASFAALLDLGFEATIARMVGYVWAGAARVQAFGLGDEDAHSPRRPNLPLLARLLATLRSYYRGLGIGVFILLIAGGGTWVWMKTAALPDATLLRWAWVAYALGACLNFVSGRWPALLAGIGAIRESQQVGVIAALVYYVVAFAGLMAGFGLWALVVAVLVMGAVARWLGRRVFVERAVLPDGIPPANFHRDIFAAIWPNAWRMGLVSLGTFMIIQANTLVCSAFLDLKTTASYGISFQLVMLLVGISSIWVQVKMPVINQLRVAGDLAEIARIFAARMRLLILSFAAGALAIIVIAPAVLQAIGSKTNVLPMPLLSTLLLIQFLEMHHSQYGSLVLTENRNPFLRPALISGGLIVVLSAVLTPRLGVWGLLLSSGCVQLAFNNWWPVLRGIRGLGMTTGQFGRLFLTGRVPPPNAAPCRA